MKKKPEISIKNDTDTPVENIETQSKKKWRSADMVFVGGLIAIVGGMLWMMGVGSSEEISTDKTVKSARIENKQNIKKEDVVMAVVDKQEGAIVNVASTPAPTPQKKEETPPFVYDNKADFSTDNLMPPPETYEKNNTVIAQKIAKIEKPTPIKEEVKQKPQAIAPTVTPQTQAITAKQEINTHEPKVSKSVPVEVNTVVDTPAKRENQIKESIPSSEGYVCSIVEAYQNMLGKEIMYYTKDTQSNKYTPAYSQANWDESGVLVKKKLMVTRVDLSERMAEVDKDKWIPALEFMTCTVLHEAGQ